MSDVVIEEMRGTVDRRSAPATPEIAPAPERSAAQVERATRTQLRRDAQRAARLRAT